MSHTGLAMTGHITSRSSWWSSTTAATSSSTYSEVSIMMEMVHWNEENVNIKQRNRENILRENLKYFYLLLKKMK